MPRGIQLLILWTLLSVPLASAEYWHKEGIGRVIRIANLTNSPDFVVASEKAVVSRLTGESLQIVWRAPPADITEEIESISVFEHFEPPIALVLLTFKSNQQIRTKTVRAIDLQNGTVLWNVPGCHIGFFHVDKSSPFTGLVAIRICSQSDNLRLHQRSDGKDVTQRMASFASDASLSESEAPSPTDVTAMSGDVPHIAWHEAASGSGQQTPSGDLTWTDLGMHTLQKPRSSERETKVLELISRANGKLSLRRKGEREDLSSRHEGMAHAISATFCSVSSKKSNVPDILVTMSEFGTLFGFDLKNEGALLWEHEIELNDANLRKDNCKLISGHANNIVVVCTHGRQLPSGHSSVAVIDGTSGGGLLGTYLHDFHAAHAYVHKDCCSPYETCVHLINDKGLDTVVSTCDDDFVGNMQWQKHNPLYFSVSRSKTHIEGLQAGRIAWRFQLPALMKVASVAFERESHPSSRSMRKASVRVTGNRKLLYKFMDQGTFLVLAEPEHNSANKLTAIVVDGTSGSVIKAVDHVNASKPYSAVRSDNWAVYSYWNTYLLQQELHVIDMYEASAKSKFMQTRAKARILELLTPALRILDLRPPPVSQAGNGDCPAALGEVQCITGTGKGMRQVASMPELLHTSFLLSHRVNALDVSETEGGVTERSILFSLSSGQIVSLSRLALDARRPLTDSDPETAEGLSPYYPYISFLASNAAGQYISRNNYITGASGMVVAPVPRQESSSHVAVFGTDLMYCKFAPAGSFDTLPSNFRFSAVIVSVLLLCFSAYYSERALEAKQLKAAWE